MMYSNTYTYIRNSDYVFVEGELTVHEMCTVIPRLTSDPANEFFG